MFGAIILAGGESTRIGQNKALLDIKGKPLIQVITEKISSLFDNVYIVSPDLSEYKFLENVNFVKDSFSDKKGILPAIYSGLEYSNENHNFVFACDMPYLNLNLINYIKEITGEFDAVVPIVKYKPVTLHTVYSKNCLSSMKKVIEQNNKKVTRIFRSLNVKYIPEEALKTEDPDLKSFFHIKTYLDYMLL